MTHKCASCGIEFSTKKSQSKFCSLKCSSERRKLSTTQIEEVKQYISEVLDIFLGNIDQYGCSHAKRELEKLKVDRTNKQLIDEVLLLDAASNYQYSKAAAEKTVIELKAKLWDADNKLVNQLLGN